MEVIWVLSYRVMLISFIVGKMLRFTLSHSRNPVVKESYITDRFEYFLVHLWSHDSAGKQTERLVSQASLKSKLKRLVLEVPKSQKNGSEMTELKVFTRTVKSDEKQFAT